ncbi:MAG TPA: hypothetical protein VII63_04535 [Caulobacteraceae bacterium]
MTLSADLRGRRLHAYDGHAATFIQECGRRAPAGRAIAAADLELLMQLSRRLGADARAWSALLSRLDLAAAGGLDPLRSADIVLETVFEESLEPSAWRVLAAGVALDAG